MVTNAKSKVALRKVLLIFNLWRQASLYDLAFHLTGLDINFANTSGFTPLYLSALGGHKKSSKYLIKMGADPNR